jgi:hypothetical protein
MTCNDKGLPVEGDSISYFVLPLARTVAVIAGRPQRDVAIQASCLPLLPAPRLDCHASPAMTVMALT